MAGVDVAIHRRPHARSRAIADALVAGFARHGLTAAVTDADMTQGCRVASVWGGHQRVLWEGYQRAQVPMLVGEAGYVGDRDVWTSLGWDGLNGAADFLTDDVPADRWRRHFPDVLQPWRSQDGPVLVIGQVPGDASLEGLDFPLWATDMVAAIAVTGRDVWFRMHPVSPVFAPPGARRVSGPLAAQLEQVSAVVTYSSTVGVTALLAGLPTMAVSRLSMAYPIAAHDLTALWAMRDDPVARQRWAHRLAYSQWREDEIAAGAAWAHLRGRVDAVG